jgi:hypothetical protein
LVFLLGSGGKESFGNLFSKLPSGIWDDSDQIMQRACLEGRGEVTVTCFSPLLNSILINLQVTEMFKAGRARTHGEGRMAHGRFLDETANMFFF